MASMVLACFERLTACLNKRVGISLHLKDRPPRISIRSEISTKNSLFPRSRNYGRIEKTEQEIGNDRGELKNMAWLNLNSYERQEYVELRLNAPKAEKILLEFNPLKISDTPDWNPAWEEWHCYRNPLRIYQQDYEILVDYFNKIYPIKDAFDGTLEQEFSVCFDNWIGKNDWIKIIFEIEKDLNGVLDGERIFLTGFLEWLKEALKYSSIIVVEGNL